MDDQVVIVTLTAAGRALRERLKDVPARAKRCIDLPPEKAEALHPLLYELLTARKGADI